ncbi:AMP-binding protein, partial [Legionella oakridgensis]|uniref:AMP-binding protein n=1 Tax=Legionella oakridgensis TaxID=29423 RepID=UPI001EE654E5
MNHYNAWMQSHDAYRNAKVIDCSSSIAFDATVNVLITPLVTGQTVVICPVSVKEDATLYGDYLRRYKIDLVKVTPSYLPNLIPSVSPYIRCLIVGGERANQYSIAAWMSEYPEACVIHHYGPTELTVGCVSHLVEKDASILPLGRVASNLKAYVLDAHLNPLPIGAVGELYISGAGVARGDLNQP